MIRPSMGVAAVLGAVGLLATLSYGRSLSPVPLGAPEPTARAVGGGPFPSAPVACQDQDGDGYGLGCAAGRDCNDRDATIHPGQAETCNLRDDDCNGLVDDSPDCRVAALDQSPVAIPGGRFPMGSPSGTGAPDEHPRHEVTVASYRIDRYEVTNARYGDCVKAGVCSAPQLRSSHLRSDYYGNPAFGDYPVIFVDWAGAERFCRWAGGRLPSEAEWEFAARGSASTSPIYPWGDASPNCERANLGGALACVGDTDRVGRRPAGFSPFGVADMAGNVWEWVADWYDKDYYSHSPLAAPTGPSAGSLKVMRGGCWLSDSDSLRVACRKAELPTTWAYNVGFRCAYSGASAAADPQGAAR